MTIVQLRNLVKQAYLSIAWTQKVDRMSDQQVTAIFFRLKEQGKIKGV
jgi:hypothetical protein